MFPYNGEHWQVYVYVHLVHSMFIVVIILLLKCLGLGDEDSKRPSRMQQQSLNSELILSKEQLYDMFQQILGVKKFEHQLLFNALMVRHLYQLRAFLLKIFIL